MRITKVELKNIKNYSDPPPFEFGPGIVAICGPNGSGKTTILEAIGWVLFDHLSYSRGNFVKNGEKRGEARVSFISQDDGREYQVIRDTAGAYYVYDPQLKIKLVEQKAMVGKWLRQHLGVEPGTDLPALFRTTIGVPQGTFTVDFAETPAKRKPTFDRILKVEEYQQSAELMKDVVKLIDKKLSEVREQIAGAEGELKRYDEVVLENARIESQLSDAQNQMRQAIDERDRTQAELTRLDDLKSQIDDASKEIERLSFRTEQQGKQKTAIEGEYQRARTAAGIVAATTAGHQAYLAARDRLNELSAQRTSRDSLRTELSKIETEKIRSQSAAENIARQLIEIDDARKEIAALGPKLSQQEKLELERSELQRQVGKLQSLENSKIEFEKELNLQRKRYTETSKQIEETEKLKPAAERVAKLEDEISGIEKELSAKELTWKNLRDRRAEFDRIRVSVGRLKEEVASLESKLAGIAERADIGDRATELESLFQKLTDETATLNAEIIKDKKMLKEVANGLCPLLSERCLNMKEGQTLDQYFSVQLGDNQTRLRALSEEKKRIESDLKTARAAAVELAQRADFTSQHARRQEELRFHESHITELESLISGAGDLSDESINSMKSSVAKLKSELAVARADQSRYERLEPLRQTLEEIKQEGKRRRELFDKQQQELAELSTSSVKLAEIEKELTTMGDPRGRIRQLEITVGREDQLKKSQSAEADRETSLNSQIALINARLGVFESLDLQWQETIARQAANEKDYQGYLGSVGLAETVETRQRELTEITSSIQALTDSRRELNERFAQLSENYDGVQHQSKRTAIEQLRGRIVRLEADTETLSARLAIIKAELDQLNLVKARVSEHLATRSKLEELGELSEFIRDCLKKAGPHITEAYLYTISISANQLYRDITGNALVNLKWDRDYEIILEEGGRERPFANLSGGEQMAAALAVRLALLKELSDLRIAFFDEPTTNMDEERRRNLAQQIGHITDFEQLFVITHDDSFEGYTDETINIGKPNAEAATLGAE